MIIIRYRELWLKGKNRIHFEKALQRNIQECLTKNNIPFSKVWRTQGRIIIFTNTECPQLQYVFGIGSFSYAKEYSLDFEEIKTQVLKLYTQGTFRITCKRMQDYFLSSTDLEKEIGAYVVEKTNAKVKLKYPDINIQIEIFNEHSYIFTESILGSGGLPITKEPHVVLLLQDKNSIQAGIQMMKRGCNLNVYKEKDIDYSELKKYEYGFHIKELSNYPNENTVVVVSDTLKTIKEYPFFVFRPLIIQ
ncbi:MAG: thiamine biosynthesis protein ThiI [archaeon GW2011_AR17]|nr:MAG: thiamine biosynthesis protein ThiI [archaeon GW2011_AR17]MBS3154016.1 hypothetical protein [Candidatus Woesearchaeota archaeon]HIH15596.1 hypothetical protein [Nanoarchaeota archaeon]HIH59074.1 hypothetical protein [Nanoarchaeota archaeon]HII14639.1 hypothetical protein [Nanoarchaeota archaeon]